MFKSTILLIPLFCLGQTTRPETEFERIFREGILENPFEDEAKLDAVAGLGPEAHPRLVESLRAREYPVESNAWCVLARMGLGRQVMKDTLTTGRPWRRSSAVRYIGAFRDDPEILEAYADCIVWTRLSLLGDAWRTISQMYPADRDRMAKVLVPRLIAGLSEPRSREPRDEFNARRFRQMVMILGQLAEPGDADALTALDVVARRPAEDWVEPSFPQWRKGEVEKDVARIPEAVQFAQANLGDAAAEADFARDLLNGSVEVRRIRMEMLQKRRKSPQAIALAISVIDDETPLKRVLIAPPEYQRACDMAIEALAKWHGDCPVPVLPGRIYPPDQLPEARQWARQVAQQAGAEAPLPGGAGQPFRITATSSAPADALTTRPASQPASQQSR